MKWQKEREYYSSIAEKWKQAVSFKLDSGKVLTTSLSVIEEAGKNSKLYSMFSNQYHLFDSENEPIFIDRDAITFELVIGYLRNSAIPQFQNRTERELFR